MAEHPTSHTFLERTVTMNNLDGRIGKNYLLVGNFYFVRSDSLDQENGPYETIQEAIDHAEPGQVIKINTGLYSDNIVIE